MNLRQTKKERTRREILEAGGTLFRKRGYDQTRVVDIIERVGISEQTFFNYFPTKDDLLSELALQWMSEGIGKAHGEPVIWASPEDQRRVGAVGRAVLRERLRRISDDREFVRLLFTRSSLFNPRGDVEGKHAQRTAQLHQQSRLGFEILGRLFKSAQTQGEIRADVDPLEIGEIFYGAISAIIRNWLTDYWDDPGDLEDRVLRAIDIVLDGLRPREVGK